MNFVDLIIKKRDGKELTSEEISFFIEGVTQGTIPDYQISSLLMAILFQGLNKEETGQLTMAMVHSGDILDLSKIKGFKVDKHSTGGVADTTTLILAPLVASLGVPVIKMSGRGLGFTGGTLDKLESIPHFQTGISEADAFTFAEKSNIVIMSQTKALVPADQKLYALRDVTGTVESLPLIAASIMSKKIAAGADGIVLDVKCGSGAFMKDLTSARALAKTMIEIDEQIGKKITVVISSMEQPLGQYIGNRLEVMEAIEVLKGNVTGDLLTVSLTLGAYMLLLAKKVKTEEEGKKLLLEQIQNGKGLAKWRELIEQQQGDASIIDDISSFKLSSHRLEVKASKSGYLTHMNTAQIGRAALETGAGRARKEDTIDYGAGIILKKRIGEKVEKGEILAELFSESVEKNKSAERILLNALTIGEQPCTPPPLILDILT